MIKLKQNEINESNWMFSQMEKIFLLVLGPHLLLFLTQLKTVHGLKSRINHLECTPDDHKIHLSKSSRKTFPIRCTLTGLLMFYSNHHRDFILNLVNVNSEWYSAWDIDKVRNSPGSYIRSQTQVTQNSTVQNIIIDSEVFIDQKSSVMKSVVRLTLSVSVDSVALEEVVYTVSCGSDSSLILICVFGSVGLLSICGALVSFFIVRRRRQRAPAPLTQSDEDLWADVDLSDTNTGFQVRVPYHGHHVEDGVCSGGHDRQPHVNLQRELRRASHQQVHLTDLCHSGSPGPGVCGRWRPALLEEGHGRPRRRGGSRSGSARGEGLRGEAEVCRDGSQLYYLPGAGSCPGGLGLWLHHRQKNRLRRIWIFTHNFIDFLLMQILGRVKSSRYEL